MFLKKSKGALKILIANTHPIFREKVWRTLQTLAPGSLILGVQDNATALKVFAQYPQLDLVILGVSPYDSGGPDIFKSLHEHQLILPTILVVSECPQNTSDGLSDGGSALLDILQLIFSGRTYDLHSRSSMHKRTHDSALTTKGKQKLTTRQREVLALLSEGMTNKEIARVLNVSDGTVKLHMARILKLLNVANRTQAVIQASLT